MSDMQPALPGVYDNTATMCREVWYLNDQGGLEVVQSISADAVEQYMANKPPAFQMRWGNYPDVRQEPV